MKYFCKLLFLCVVFIPACCLAADTFDVSNVQGRLAEALAKHPNTEPFIVMLLPVVASERVNIKVKLPKNFVLIGNANPSFMQFILNTDKDPSNWTENVTLISNRGLGISAKYLIDTVVSSLKTTQTNVQVLDQSNGQKKGYEEAGVLIVYNSGPRRELLKMYAASGPKDSSVVQDTVLLKSDDELKAARTKLENFFKENVSVMAGTIISE